MNLGTTGQKTFERSRIVTVLQVCAYVLVFAISGVTDSARGNPDRSAEMPRLERAMVFTADISNALAINPRMSSFIRSIESGFPDVVKASKRFRIMDDELSLEARRDSKARAQLVDQFEVDAFFTLEVASRGDTIDLTARLLSPTLKILLQESESVDLVAMAAADAAVVRKVLEPLVFRMVNRIPYDAKVLSIQGRFVVLSGGSEQGVVVGDKVEIEDTRVNGRHPATGAWTKFTTRRLGEGKVIELKDRTAIAQLLTQSSPGAIRVGHTVKLSRLASRARFARESDGPRYGSDVLGAAASGGGTDVIPVVPMVSGNDMPSGRNEKPTQPSLAANKGPSAPATPSVQLPRVSPSAVPVAKKGEVQGDVESKVQSKVQGQQQVISDKAAPVVSEAEGGYGGGSEDDVSETWFGQIAAGIFTNGELGLGLRSWSVSGPVAASTAAPYTLVNNISLRGTRRLSPEASGDIEADFSFGSTTKATFTGYDMRANGYLEYPVAGSSADGSGAVDLGPVRLTKWRYGGVGRLVGLSVNGESFGGLDAFFLGGFVGGRGNWDLGDNSRGLAVQGDLFLYPLTVGSYGYRGSKYSISSALGTGVELKIFRPAAETGSTEYGLTWQYEMHSFALGNGRDAVYDSSRFYLGLRSEL